MLGLTKSLDNLLLAEQTLCDSTVVYHTHNYGFGRRGYSEKMEHQVINAMKNLVAWRKEFINQLKIATILFTDQQQKTTWEFMQTRDIMDTVDILFTKIGQHNDEVRLVFSEFKKAYDDYCSIINPATINVTLKRSREEEKVPTSEPPTKKTRTSFTFGSATSNC